MPKLDNTSAIVRVWGLDRSSLNTCKSFTREITNLIIQAPELKLNRPMSFVHVLFPKQAHIMNGPIIVEVDVKCHSFSFMVNDVNDPREFTERILACAMEHTKRQAVVVRCKASDFYFRISQSMLDGFSSAQTYEVESELV